MMDHSCEDDNPVSAGRSGSIPADQRLDMSSAAVHIPSPRTPQNSHIAAAQAEFERRRLAAYRDPLMVSSVSERDGYDFSNNEPGGYTPASPQQPPSRPCSNDGGDADDDDDGGRSFPRPGDGLEDTIYEVDTNTSTTGGAPGRGSAATLTGYPTSDNAIRVVEDDEDVDGGGAADSHQHYQRRRGRRRSDGFTAGDADDEPLSATGPGAGPADLRSSCHAGGVPGAPLGGVESALYAEGSFVLAQQSTLMSSSSSFAASPAEVVQKLSPEEKREIARMAQRQQQRLQQQQRDTGKGEAAVTPPVAAVLLDDPLEIAGESSEGAAGPAAGHVPNSRSDADLHQRTSTQPMIGGDEHGDGMHTGSTLVLGAPSMGEHHTTAFATPQRQQLQRRNSKSNNDDVVFPPSPDYHGDLAATANNNAASSAPPGNVAAVPAPPPIVRFTTHMRALALAELPPLFTGESLVLTVMVVGPISPVIVAVPVGQCVATAKAEGQHLLALPHHFATRVAICTEHMVIAVVHPTLDAVVHRASFYPRPHHHHHHHATHGHQQPTHGSFTNGSFPGGLGAAAVPGGGGGPSSQGPSVPPTPAPPVAQPPATAAAPPGLASPLLVPLVEPDLPMRWNAVARGPPGANLAVLSITRRERGGCACGLLQAFPARPPQYVSGVLADAAYAPLYQRAPGGDDD